MLQPDPDIVRQKRLIVFCHLKQRGKDVKGVHGAGAVGVGHQLVDVRLPGLFCIVTHCRLEGRQDGREEGRGGRWKPEIFQVIDIIA